MHRTSSTTRVSDEFFNSSTPQSAAADADQLPTYDPISHVAKKERIRIRSAENAIHAIPLVLIICAIILWFFSNPVDIVNKGASISIVARPKPKDLTVEGGGQAQKRLLTDLEQGDSDPAKDLLLHQKGTKSSTKES